jgi:hypothetical protein
MWVHALVCFIFFSISYSYLVFFIPMLGNGYVMLYGNKIILQHYLNMGFKPVGGDWDFVNEKYGWDIRF